MGRTAHRLWGPEHGENECRMGVDDEIRRYLGTGEHDMLFPAWAGENTLDRLNRGHAAMLDALVAEVKCRAGTPDVPAGVQGLDLVEFGRKKAEPMARVNSRGRSRMPSWPWSSDPSSS